MPRLDQVVMSLTMSTINIQQNHKDDLGILVQQPIQVILDFCKLASNFLTKGTNIKLYQIASQKLGFSVTQIQSAVEGLVFLFLESCKNELSEELFSEVVKSIGFKEEYTETLYKEYLLCKSILDRALPQTAISYTQFRNLEWRFETQISSKSIRNEIIPRVLMKIDLEKGSRSESICIESNIPNIIHMCQVLNQALEESRTNHSRRIQRAII